ncbi:MAG: metabolite traffic protein EboE [Planctomycetota bacterium]
MAPRITYCTNVHPAPDLDQQLATLRDHVAPVAAAARTEGRAFGLGGWWPMQLVEVLHADAAARARLRGAMDDAGAPLWTLNVFPFGDFHQEVVKTAVYAPDWGDEERLLYTRRCAEVGAQLLGRGDVLPMSTLPLGYRGDGEAPADVRRMARNLARAASMLAAIEADTGVRCVLALEPEPNCLLETVAQAADFLDRWLFEEGAWTTVPAEHLRRHLGVCVDLCHLAVLDEDPLAALAELRRRGIEVPKIQVSSCLEVRHANGIEPLLAFEEPRYLHQTMAANGLRSLDLDGVRARRAEFERAGRVRTHYHVPLDWDQDGPFGSTQQQVRRVLEALAADSAPVPLLEVETYTWSVLGDTFGDAPLHQRIRRELDWVAAFWKN